MGIIKEIKISIKKGEKKQSVKEGVLIKNYGLEGDFHGEEGKTQITILDEETLNRITKIKNIGLCTQKFSANIVTKGIELYNLQEGSTVKIGEAEIEISKIGKRCYKDCKLLIRNMGCALRKEAVFAKITKTGSIKLNDAVAEKSREDI